MLKLFKWFAGVVLVLVALVVLAIIIIPKVFDPNDHRDTIISLVKDKTDRDLRLDGDLSVSVFPWLGVRTQGLGFSQPDAIGGDMIAVDTAQLRIKLLPLLSKKVEIDTVVLDQPVLRMVTLKNGIDSFSGLSDEEESEVEESEEESSDVVIAIEGVQINDAQVIIDDKSEQSRYEISGFNLNTGNLLSGSFAPISASGVLLDSTNPSNMKFDLSAKARIDADSLNVEMKEMALKATLDQDEVNLGFDSLSFSQSKVLKVDQLTALWSGAQSAKLSTDSVNVDLDKQVANISNTLISMGDLKATLSNISASKIIDNPAVSGDLKVESFNARKLIKEFEVDFEPSNSDALKNVSVDASFKATKETAGLSNMVVVLDESALKGSMSVANFDKPRINFDLALNSLNLDHYLPEDEEVDEATEEGFDADSLSVPMSAFKDLNVNGHFEAAQFISSGLEFNDIDVKIASSSGRVTITPKASLYDGKSSGVISFTEQSGSSVLKIKNEVDAVALGDMLKAADITEQLSGLGSLLVDVVVTERNGVQSNEGTIKLVAKDGALKGIDLQGMIKKGYNSFSSVTGSKASNEELSSSSDDETKFAELLGTFHLKDFKVTNDDFSMKAPLFRVAGAGDIFLDSQLLDYTVDFSVVNTIQGQGGAAFDKLKGLTIPIRLKGALTEPKYSIDWNTLYKGLAKQKVEEQKAKLLKDKLGIDGGDTSTKGVLTQLLKKQVSGDESDEATEEAVETDSEPKSTEDQLKDELKNKLLKGLF